jgi:hypothetical protein
LEYDYTHIKQTNVENGVKTIMIKNSTLVYPDGNYY